MKVCVTQIRDVPQLVILFVKQKTQPVTANFTYDT